MPQSTIYRKKLKFAVVLIVAALILAFPEAAAAGAQRAMRVWYDSVAPSLFPFLMLMPALTGSEACAAYEFLFGRIMRPLFRLPGAAASAMIAGMLSGSPGGAIAVRRIAAQGSLTPSEAHRIALAVSGVSPAFLIFGVGRAMLGSAEIGFRLVGIQLAVQLILLFALRGVEFGSHRIVDASEQKPSGVLAAVETILSICGYMTFFSALAEVAERIQPTVGRAMLLIMDLPSGLRLLSEMQFRGKFLLIGAEIGFGGLCVARQNLDALRAVGVRAGEYFAVRGCAAMLFGCLSTALIGTGNASKGLIREDPLLFSVIFAMMLSIPTWILIISQHSFNKRKSGS